MRIFRIYAHLAVSIQLLFMRYSKMRIKIGGWIIVCPLIAIFGVPSRCQPLSRRQADVIAFASILARRRILLSWTSPQPPSISVWLKDFFFFLNLKK